MEITKRESRFILSGLGLILVSVLLGIGALNADVSVFLFVGILAANGVFEYRNIQTKLKLLEDEE